MASVQWIAVTGNDALKSDDNLAAFTWTLTDTNVDGIPLSFAQYADHCWQMVGNWSATGVIKVQGSNDGVVWFDLHDAAGAAVASFSADGGKQIIERPLYLRPFRSTPGAGALNVVITIFMRKIARQAR